MYYIEQSHARSTAWIDNNSKTSGAIDLSHYPHTYVAFFPLTNLSHAHFEQLEIIHVYV